MVNGRVQCYQYGLEEHKHLWTSKTFKKSCRDVSFSVDGSKILAVSRDRSIQTLDIETGNSISSRELTHDCPINSLLVIDNYMSATGDDQGVIKIWDNRKDEAVMTFSEHEDYISQMTYSRSKKTLVAVGGDGYLSTWDIRKPNVVAMSDQIEDELLSIALMKNDKKAVVGTQEGILSLWTWGDWGDYNDRIVGHPNSIDAICKLDEDTICTGSSDGIIRLVGILPNEFHGVLGDHGEDMPIENLKLTHDKKYLLSSGHDDKLQFWDVAHLFQEEGEKAAIEEEEPEPEKVTKEDSDKDSWGTDSDEDTKSKKKDRKRKKTQKKEAIKSAKKNTNNTAFFADM
ncbi:unnamed protein product [Rhizopus stolonifer]